ncbi:glycosyl transferase [Rhodobacteraceae bacterium CCMM004]|nr:glycosyl transferase [Rhodobacteraceae bacterium CCMM004]
MTLGFVLMCHTALDRARQVAEHWADQGCPVVIHVDRRVGRTAFEGLKAGLADCPNVGFSRRYRCEWGTWSLVAAAQAASEQMLADHPEVSHVYLVSGSCLPLRPVRALRDYLATHPRTDFIESVTTRDVPWTVGGLDAERFTLRFPFSWKRRRRLFDAYVALQRRLRLRRTPPHGLVPHMGSQWWCLTRQTLSAILQDPLRPDFDRYFRTVWIPDESYFQSLVRRCSPRVESRSLTLSKFDFQGKPHVFYDDHLQLLRRSDCFVARKIWPRAERLYATFLNLPEDESGRADPNPGKIDRVFAKATERRTRGRAGLYMAGRFPNPHWENGKTAGPYAMFQGFGDLFEDFDDWLGRATTVRAHGHLFAPERAEFAGGGRSYAGALSDDAALRDYNPVAFLTNLIWNTRGERQAFLYGPRDAGAIADFAAYDANARIFVISGAWAVPLFRANRDFADVRAEAARLQRIESAQIDAYRSIHAQARVRIWTMADLVEAPMEPLQTIIEEVGARAGRRLSEAPRMVDLTGFGQFLQTLKNQGMQPYLTGDFPAEDATGRPPVQRPKPYLIR